MQRLQQFFELVLRLLRGSRLHARPVGVHDRPLDNPLLLRQEQIVRQLVEHTIRAGRVSRDADIPRVPAKISNVFVRPLQCGSLVPEAEVCGEATFLVRTGGGGGGGER